MAFGTYKEDVTAEAIKTQLGRTAKDLARAIENGNMLNEEWEAYKQGKTDVDIQSALGISSDELTDVKQAFISLRDLYSIASGDDTVTIPTGIGTYFRRLREFS